MQMEKALLQIVYTKMQWTGLMKESKVAIQRTAFITWCPQIHYGIFLHISHAVAIQVSYNWLCLMRDYMLFACGMQVI